MTKVLLDIRHWVSSNKVLFLYAAMGLSVFWLSVNFSKDWKEYEYLYYLVKIKPWPELLANFSFFKEPLYHYLSKAVGGLFGFPAFVMLSTVCLLSVKLHYFAKMAGGVLGVVFFYTCLYLLLHEGTAIRVGYAVALVVPSLYFIRERRFFLAVLLILLASQIHLSSLVFLLAFPLYFYRSSSYVVYALLACALILMLLGFSVLDWSRYFVELVNPRYLAYLHPSRQAGQNSTGLYFYFIGFFGILLSFIYFYLGKTIRSDRFIAMLFSLCVLGVVSMLFFYDFVPVGARFGELFLVPVVILLSYLAKCFYNNRMWLHHVCLILVFIAYLGARLIYLYPTMLFGV